MTREEAIKTIKNRPSFTTMNYDERKQFSEALEIAVRSLEALEQQEKTGKWIRWYETIEQEHCTIHDPHCKCSECNQEYDPYIASLFNYCPNCGARMVSE